MSNNYDKLKKLVDEEQVDRVFLSNVREKIEGLLIEAKNKELTNGNGILIPGNFGFPGMYWQIEEEKTGNIVLMYDPGEVWLSTETTDDSQEYSYSRTIYNLPYGDFYKATISRYNVNHETVEQLTYRNNKTEFMNALTELDGVGIELMTTSMRAMKS